MTTELGPSVPARLRAEIDGDADGFTILLITVGDGGWPHVAMISAGELVVVDDRTLRIATWPGSRTTANLTATGRATLSAVADATAFALRISTHRGDDLAIPGDPTLACFDAVVDSATADRAPYADLETGVRFRLRDPDAVRRRWARTRRALAGRT